MGDRAQRGQRRQRPNWNIYPDTEGVGVMLCNRDGPPMQEIMSDGGGGGMVEGWHGWVGTFNGVALITVAALPLAALAVWALARTRSDAGTAAAWRMSLAEVGIVYGTVPWVWMIMLRGDQAGSVPGRVSLVPLRDLLTILAGGPLTVTVQIVGNLLVFAALGFLAPLRFAALASVPRILVLAAGCSVLVEAAQYVLQLDRVSSVDDVLLNTAGAGLAALASHRWWGATATASSDRPRSAPAPRR
ncbi:VanZ family protein [Micromonospora sp. MS34]|uniref:VanZ family protein n=1 Tax=Micromonospora sp. MS34 TaxID=3385971 RepID=UPI0039A15B1C